MEGLWKGNWPRTRQHFADWWQRRGLVLGAWGTGLLAGEPRALTTDPPEPDSPEAQHTDPSYIAHHARHKMAHRAWPADILPAAWPHIGTLPLAACLGARPQYAVNNVWYSPCMSDIAAHPPLRFDPAHPQWVQLEQIVRKTVELAAGNYFVGMPALLGGLDVLAELRGTADLLMDMIDDPAAVHRRLREIQDAYVQAFGRLYEIIKLPDGSMCFGYFMLWGSGRTGLCQCDTATMLSPKMFNEFVIPYTREQCAYLQHSMFHVDGAGALMHLPSLLEIDELDAIEFTPDPRSPAGGDPHWYDLYRPILAAGKAVWVANLSREQVIPLLDAIGGKGVYLSVNRLRESDAEELEQLVEPYRH